MKFLRENMDDQVIRNIILIDNEFKEKAIKMHADIKASLEEYNKLGFDLFEQWNKEQFTTFIEEEFL
jgi:hypothetical protein